MKKKKTDNDIYATTEHGHFIILFHSRNLNAIIDVAIRFLIIQLSMKTFYTRFALAIPILFLAAHIVHAEERIGIFVGIDRYKNKEYSRLRVAVKDVKALAERMKPSLDRVIELHNEKATYAAIEDLFVRDLPKNTPKENCTIFIVWSGHGDRCPDEDGDEEDGFDEFLCPYDVSKDNPETFVLDDKLFAWIQQLEGRQIVLILDTCYSGGMEKSGPHVFDFFGDELANDTRKSPITHVVFASSSGCDKSHVHGSLKYSVFTYYLLEFLDSDEHGDIEEAYKYVKPRIIAHLRDFHRIKNSTGAHLFFPVKKKIRLKSR